MTNHADQKGSFALPPNIDAFAVRSAILEGDLRAFCVTDADGQLIWADAAFLSMYEHTEETLAGQHFSVLLPQKFQKEARNIHDLRARGEVKGLQDRWPAMSRNGREFMVKGTFARITTESGEAYQVTALRQCTEDASSTRDPFETEDRLALALAASGDGVWEWRPDSDVLVVSDRFLQIVGLSRAAFSGNASEIRARIHPDEHQLFRDATARVLRNGEKFSIALRVLGTEGVYRPARIRGRVIRDEDGRAARLVGLLTDETEMARTHAELLRVERIAHLGRWRVKVSDHDPQFKLSDETTRILGLPAGMTTPDLKTVFDCYHRDDLGIVMHAVERSRTTGDPCDYHARVVHPNGDLRTVRVRAEAELKPGGAVYALFGTVQDVTQRVQQASRLQEAKRLETIGQLAGGMAHDFNNILGVIMANLDGLERTPLSEDVKHRIEGAINAAEKGADLTKSLLVFSRRRKVRQLNLDLVDLIDGALPMLHALVTDSTKVAFIRPDEPAGVRLDPSLFDSALLNLAANARDAMPGGGELTIRVITTANEVILSLADSGPGIDPRIIERVREPFFTTKEEKGGTGLGLLLVEHFASQCNARFDLDNGPQGGCIAHLYFPRLPTNVLHTFTQSAPTEPERVTQDGLSGVQVILVEDNQDLGRLIRSNIEISGARVHSFQNGHSALEAIRASDGVDLLITDIDLPGGVNGAALANHVPTATPVISISGHPEEPSRFNGRTPNNTRWMTKPFRISALVKTATELVRTSRTTRR